MAVKFDSRTDAAERLAQALAHYRGKHPLVLAIPRGAVNMGRVLADRLGGELDVVLVRKLRAPFSPEFAVGSIDESGWCYVSEHAAAAGADEAWRTLDRRARAALAPLPAGDPVSIALFRESTIGGAFVGLAAVDGLAPHVLLRSGRLPHTCTPARCESRSTAAASRSLRLNRGELSAAVPV